MAFPCWRLGGASTYTSPHPRPPGMWGGGFEAWASRSVLTDEFSILRSGSPYLAAYLHHIGISFSVFTETSLISKSVQLRSTLSK